MANITELEQWEDGVYRLETTDPVEGGEDGVDNAPHKHLANRTLWLKNNKADKNGNAAEKFKVANASATDEAVNLAQLNTKANLAGSATQKFKVADGEADDEAVSKLQMEEALANIGISLSDFDNLKDTSGYQKLPNGLIIQFGISADISSNSNIQVTFPIAFPNACVSASASNQGTNTNGNIQVSVATNLNPSYMNISLMSTTSITPRPSLWIAIGY